jgi:hypothetical protein
LEAAYLTPWLENPLGKDILIWRSTGITSAAFSVIEFLLVDDFTHLASPRLTVPEKENKKEKREKEKRDSTLHKNIFDYYSINRY